MLVCGRFSQWIVCSPYLMLTLVGLVIWDLAGDVKRAPRWTRAPELARSCRIGTEQLFVTTRMDWKVAVSKIQLACLCFTAAGGQWGKPGSERRSSVFIHSIAEYWALHSVLLRCLTCYFFLLLLLLLFSCRIHDHWHHIVSKTQMSHAFFYANQCLEIVIFFVSFCIVDNKIISPDVWVYYMTTFCKHWSNHNI